MNERSYTFIHPTRLYGVDRDKFTFVTFVTFSASYLVSTTPNLSHCPHFDFQLHMSNVQYLTRVFQRQFSEYITIRCDELDDAGIWVRFPAQAKKLSLLLSI
jgi:hypothetical protein